MINVRDYNLSKERILLFLKNRGPCLPVQIARELGVSTLFAGAFLSDLKAEGKVLISNMKVGSSPLYFLPGQENLLENFIEHLNQREKEALLLLKKERILDDEKQEPVVRVALRAIKDFAINVRVNNNGVSKLFWKYFTVPESDFIALVEEKLGLKKEPMVDAMAVSHNFNKEQAGNKKEEHERKTVKKPKIKKDTLNEQTNLANKVSEKIDIKARKETTEESEFGKKVRDFLISKDIELIFIFSEKKKEIEGIVRIDGIFGKQEFYLVVKDKKSVSDSDLLLALQKAQSKKMPALFIASGELNKKAKEYIKEWRNLIKYENLKF